MKKWCRDVCVLFVDFRDVGSFDLMFFCCAWCVVDGIVKCALTCSLLQGIAQVVEKTMDEFVVELLSRTFEPPGSSSSLSKYFK